MQFRPALSASGSVLYHYHHHHSYNTVSRTSIHQLHLEQIMQNSSSQKPPNFLPSADDVEPDLLAAAEASDGVHRGTNANAHAAVGQDDSQASTTSSASSTRSASSSRRRTAFNSARVIPSLRRHETLLADMGLLAGRASLRPTLNFEQLAMREELWAMMSDNESQRSLESQSSG